MVTLSTVLPRELGDGASGVGGLAPQVIREGDWAALGTLEGEDREVWGNMEGVWTEVLSGVWRN